MLMSAVVDPSAFNRTYFDAPDYRLHARSFLQGIQSNGLLIVDPDGRLHRSLAENIQSLPTQYGQQLGILLTELLKDSRKRVIRCHPASSQETSACPLIELACHLKATSHADSLIVSSQTVEELRSKGVPDADVLPLGEYSESAFERQRYRYMEGSSPIDRLPESELDDMVIRIVRFAQWLRFYDKQIGKGGDNTSCFRMGIEYILKKWLEHGHFTMRGEGRVEIITCERKHVFKDDDWSMPLGRSANKLALQKVMDELVEPLRKNFPWPIELSVKEDPTGIFHARYLETQSVVVRFDRGFDLFSKKGKMRRNMLNIDNQSYGHLKECRGLPDVKFDAPQ
jgi:hypothetical protein